VRIQVSCYYAIYPDHEEVLFAIPDRMHAGDRMAAAAGCSSKPRPTPEQQTQADLQAYEAQIRKVVADPARADQLSR
jgi:hypothetical protein